MRHNNANKMIPPASCHMRQSQNFGKIDIFLKPVLNIYILGNLIVGWSGWVIKDRAGTLHQIFIFKGDVYTRGITIHQSKSWYYLGPS